MTEETYTMEQILRALEVSGIKATHTRKKFFDALLSEPEKLTENQQLEKCLTDGY